MALPEPLRVACGATRGLVLRVGAVGLGLRLALWGWRMAARAAARQARQFLRTPALAFAATVRCFDDRSCMLGAHGDLC